MARTLVGLSIGHSEPTGSDGIQADIKAFSSLGLHGAAVVTAVAGEPLSVAQVQAQLQVLGDSRVDVVKLTPPADAALLEAIADYLEAHTTPMLVFDISGYQAGSPLLDVIRGRILPRAYVLVANLGEAEALSGRNILDWEDTRNAGAAIHEMGPQNVVITGGRRENGVVTDLLFDGKDYRDYTAERVEIPRVPGTGSTFTAGLAASLAKGETAQHAVAAGKAYVTKALQSVYERGDEPALHHFYRYWRPTGH